MSNLQIQEFLDADTETYSYVVSNGFGTAATIIDPVLDYDPKSGRTRTNLADAMIAVAGYFKYKLGIK